MDTSIVPSKTDASIVAIIPLYNGRRWIEQSLESVLNQTLQPNEIIVVDDGSQDKGAELVEALAKSHPIELIRKKNGGQSSARNLGVRSSKSNLIAFLDQDDVWYPRHLELLSQPFLVDDKYDLPLGWTYSNLDLIDEWGRMVCRRFVTEVPTEHPKRRLMRCLSEDMHILPSASLIRRAAFESVGGFDERLAGYEDDCLFLDMFCARWNNIFVDQSLSFWRLNSTSATHMPRFDASRRIYARKLIDAFRDQPKYNWHFRKHCIAPRFFNGAAARLRQAAQLGDRKATRYCYADLWEFAPYLGRRIQLMVWLLGLLSYSPGALRLAFWIRSQWRAAH